MTSPRHAADILASRPEVDQVILVVPGDLSSAAEVSRMRKRVWGLAKRREAGPVSTTLAWQSEGATAFRIRRCVPVRRFGSYQQAVIFLSVRLGGLSHYQAAEKFGVSPSVVGRVVQRISRGLAA